MSQRRRPRPHFRASPSGLGGSPCAGCLRVVCLGPCTDQTRDQHSQANTERDCGSNGRGDGERCEIQRGRTSPQGLGYSGTGLDSLRGAASTHRAVQRPAITQAGTRCTRRAGSPWLVKHSPLHSFRCPGPLQQRWFRSRSRGEERVPLLLLQSSTFPGKAARRSS